MFADRYAAEKMLASCYWALPRLGFQWSNNPSLMGSMETVLNKDLRTTATLRLGLGEDNATSPIMPYWNSTSSTHYSLYAAIRDCNTFLDNVEGVVDLPRMDKDRMIAEVLLLKAYMHFNLIRMYGPVCPLRESPPVSESTVGVRVYREKIDDCFDYVLKLINEAIDRNALPNIIQARATELGRFTKCVALFMKAQALLYRASPLFNGNADYNSLLDPRDNQPYFNPVSNPQHWLDAAEACKEAIKYCEENGYHRLQSIEEYIPNKPISDDYLVMQNFRYAVTKPWTVEQLWLNSSLRVVGRYYSQGYSEQSDCIARFEAYSVSNPAPGRWSVPLQTVEKFYSSHGVPLEEDREWLDGADKLYDNRFKPRRSDANYQKWIQIGEESAGMNFDREIRFYASLGFDRGKWYANGNNNMPDNELSCAVVKARYGEYSAGVMTSTGAYNATGYWPKKLVCDETVFTDANSLFQGNMVMPEMRYADLLLMAAEAINETKSQPDAEVWELIDRVRARAGLEGIVESYNTYAAEAYRDKPLTKAGMRTIIPRERAIELAFEGSYHWDVRRWKTAPQELNRLIQGWTLTEKDAEGYYQPATIYSQKFTLRDYFMPVPDADIIKNPLLVQNLGW
jgi:hypothetical protein